MKEKIIKATGYIIYIIYGSFWLFIIGWILYRILFKIYRWLAI